MPQNAFQDTFLHGDLGPLDGIVPRMALGLAMVTTGLPSRDRRTAGGAGNESHRNAGIIPSHPDTESLPKASTSKRLVKMKGIDRGNPFVLLVQHEDSRMGLLVLGFHFAATRHVRLADQKIEVKLLLVVGGELALILAKAG